MSRKLAPPITWVYGNLSFGRDLRDPWAAFQFPCHSYDGLSREGKVARFGDLMAFAEVVEADFQIIRVARAWDVDRWAETQLANHTGPHTESHSKYVEAHRDRLRNVGRSQPSVFASVRLAEPTRDIASYVSEAFDADPRTWWSDLRRDLRDHRGRALEVNALEALRRRADDTHQRISDFVADARPASATDLQWLVRRAFCRALGEPEVDGMDEPQAVVFDRNDEAMLAPLEADVVRWMDGHVEHRGRCLRIESELGTSWQATLVLGAFPERSRFPGRRAELMFAHAEALPFPVDMSLNCRWLPNAIAQRMTKRIIQDADQVLAAEDEGDQGVTDQSYQRTQTARDLLGYLQSATHPPLLKGTLIVTLAGKTEEELHERIATCRREFGELKLRLPVGDQLELFCQGLPGQPTRVRGYDRLLTVEEFAATMPTATHAVGSNRGPYFGHTLSGSRQPAQLDLREGSRTNRNTTVLAIGALGSGKTVATQKLVYEAFLENARIIDVDPKGDHKVHLLPDVQPHAETIPLTPDRNLRGLLDPLRVSPDHLRQEAAVSFLTDLLPPRSPAEWETSIVDAVDRVNSNADRPTCFEVVRHLSAGSEIDRHVGRTLEVYARSGLTQLGFADPDVALPRVGAGQYTYLPIRDLPAAQPNTPRDQYSREEKVGEQIVRLIALFSMHLLAADHDRLKLWVFDEGHRLLSDGMGRRLLESLSRMGRSELAVPIIGTQLVTDTMLGGIDLEGLIGVTLVFGVRSDREAGRALQLLSLDPDDRRMRQRLLEFEAGECLLRDHRGRSEAVQVDVLPELLAHLSTTPPEQRDRDEGPDAQLAA
jgi:hypothetical protein